MPIENTSDLLLIEKDDLICPITHLIFEHPVVLSDGFTYERKAIEDWLKIKDTSPKTNERLVTKTLIPNLTLHSIIENCLDRYRYLR